VNGLIIRSPCVEMILEGKKTWEMRGAYTHVRGKIGSHSGRERIGRSIRRCIQRLHPLDCPSLSLRY